MFRTEEFKLFSPVIIRVHAFSLIILSLANNIKQTLGWIIYSTKRQLDFSFLLNGSTFCNLFLLQ